MGITSRAVDSQSTKRRALFQPFGRCGALFALCGHSYILGVIHKRRIFMRLKRVISAALAVSMAVSMMPATAVSAFATDVGNSVAVQTA